MVEYSANEKISDEEEIIRWIHPDFLYPDESVNLEAFRPRPQDFKDGVSVSLFRLLTDTQIIRSSFVKNHNSSAGLLLAAVPNTLGYAVKFTKKKHCVINEDVVSLSKNEQALLTLANNTSVIFNPSIDTGLRQGDFIPDADDDS